MPKTTPVKTASRKPAAPKPKKHKKFNPTPKQIVNTPLRRPPADTGLWKKTQNDVPPSDGFLGPPKKEKYSETPSPRSHWDKKPGRAR